MKTVILMAALILLPISAHAELSAREQMLDTEYQSGRATMDSIREDTHRSFAEQEDRRMDIEREQREARAERDAAQWDAMHREEEAHIAARDNPYAQFVK